MKLSYKYIFKISFFCGGAFASEKYLKKKMYILRFPLMTFDVNQIKL